MKIKLINCSAAIAAVLIVLGMGFCPVTRIVPYTCTTTQPYTCEITQYYDCNKSQQYICRYDCPAIPRPLCNRDKICTEQIYTINGCSEQVESICYEQAPNTCYKKESQRLWW